MQKAAEKVSIIGAGSFGTAMAKSLAESGKQVRLWAREEDIAESINSVHKNCSYLKDIVLPDSVRCYNDMESTLKEAELVVIATPSHTVRDICEKLKPLLSGNEYIVSLAKGIENDTYLTTSQVIVQVLEDVIPEEHVGVLYGPSHAEEVALNHPTTMVSTAYSKRAAKLVQLTFITPMLRIYLNRDITGVEVGGSVKNIMAIAAGIIDGANLGDNAKAALVTRGLHEMKRLGMRLGAFQETFSGLTGVGDLVVTCCSSHSRNRFVGTEIGKGRTMEDIISHMKMVAEGIKTTKSVYFWAQQLKIEMPITEAVYKVLFENVSPKDAMYELMTREPKDEIMI